jgi:hypothetical protein
MTGAGAGICVGDGVVTGTAAPAACRTLKLSGSEIVETLICRAGAGVIASAGIDWMDAGLAAAAL